MPSVADTRRDGRFVMIPSTPSASRSAISASSSTVYGTTVRHRSWAAATSVASIELASGLIPSAYDATSSNAAASIVSGFGLHVEKP